jgi:hypothetical protein
MKTTTPIPTARAIEQAVQTLRIGAHAYERHDDYHDEKNALILRAAANILAELRP